MDLHLNGTKGFLMYGTQICILLNVNSILHRRCTVCLDCVPFSVVLIMTEMEC